MAAEPRMGEPPVTAQPRRREQRRTRLDASVVPVEQALLARAGELSSNAMQAFSVLGPECEDGTADPARIEPNLKLMLADEFRALAEELHWQ
jgi:hypothetical protein